MGNLGTFLCTNNIFYFCFFISNAISVPQMQLQIVPSHCTKSCCGKWYKTMLSTKVEEVKIVNDSVTCFRQQGDQREFKNADSLNKP